MVVVDVVHLAYRRQPYANAIRLVRIKASATSNNNRVRFLDRAAP